MIWAETVRFCLRDVGWCERTSKKTASFCDSCRSSFLEFHCSSFEVFLSFAVVRKETMCLGLMWKLLHAKKKFNMTMFHHFSQLIMLINHPCLQVKV